MAEHAAPLRIGVAGVGSLGFHHARIARELAGVVMVGFHEPRPDRAMKVAEQLGIPSFPDLSALLDAVDALVVAAPTTIHAEIACAALARRIHVFIEKPIASDLAQADRILDAAARSGAIVQVGHVERFNAALVGARPYLEAPLFIESHRLAPFTERGTDVAVVLDLMIHDVDLVASLVGRPVESFEATGIPVLTSSVDIANARLTFEGGAVANLTASRVSLERMRKLRIFQKSGYMSLNLANGTGEFLRLKQELPTFLEGGRPDGAGPLALDIGKIVERIQLSAEPVEPLRRELESFRDAILSDTAPLVSGRDGRNALATVLAIEERIMSHVSRTSAA
ncbi:MAG: Gfo/Idh/MocA family oxidoreductase [Gemmatimonadetes bacterium]|nr:Gfo/Idh/MocA family oxidoreductase [Gemmatimonadota bacterium]